MSACGISTWNGRMSVPASTVMVMATSYRNGPGTTRPPSAQRAECRSQLAREEIRLLPRGEVVAPVDFVEVDEVRVGLLGPASRSLVELAGEDADGGRDRRALHVEEAEGVLEVETARRDPGVRHPGHRDVVEDLVRREVANRVAVEPGRDVLEAEGIVVEHPGGERRRRVRQAIQRLRPVAHLDRVA